MAWISPTGYFDDDNKWDWEANVYDGALWTVAYTTLDIEDAWGSFLCLTHDSMICDKIRFYVNGGICDSRTVDLDAFYDGEWHNMYQGAFIADEEDTGLIWAEISFDTSHVISQIRLRFYRVLNAGPSFFLTEVQFNEIIIMVTTEAATVPDPVANSSYEFADGNGTITSGTNATERGFEVKHEYSGNLFGALAHQIAGFEGDVSLNGVIWEGTLIKTETESGNFAEGAFTLVLGAFPSFFYDKLFAGESYSYRTRATIDSVEYFGEWVAFSLGNFPSGVPVGGDDISGGNPVVPIIPIVPIEPPVTPIEPIKEEFPEFELPEFELPGFSYPEIPPYNGSWLGWFYYRKPYTKKDLDELRKKCRIFQDNSVEYALVINHNARVMQQFLNSMTEYLGADEYNTFRPIMPTQHLNALAREVLGVKDFKEIINNFINNSIDNANNVNNNFQLIRSGLGNYTYTEDEGFRDITIRTNLVNDDNPDVEGLKKVIDRLNLEMASNYETINHNLQVLRAILF